MLWDHLKVKRFERQVLLARQGIELSPFFRGASGCKHPIAFFRQEQCGRFAQTVRRAGDQYSPSTISAASHSSLRTKEALCYPGSFKGTGIARKNS